MFWVLVQILLKIALMKNYYVICQALLPRQDTPLRLLACVRRGFLLEALFHFLYTCSQTLVNVVETILRLSS